MRKTALLAAIGMIGVLGAAVAPASDSGFQPQFCGRNRVDLVRDTGVKKVCKGILTDASGGITEAFTIRYVDSTGETYVVTRSERDDNLDMTFYDVKSLADPDSTIFLSFGVVQDRNGRVFSIRGQTLSGDLFNAR